MKGNKKSLCDICVYYEISRSQRAKEVKAGLGTIGTHGYTIQGCYDCDGYNQSCPKYYRRSDYMIISKEKQNEIKPKK